MYGLIIMSIRGKRFATLNVDTHVSYPEYRACKAFADPIRAGTPNGARRPIYRSKPTYI